MSYEWQILWSFKTRSVNLLKICRKCSINQIIVLRWLTTVLRLSKDLLWIPGLLYMSETYCLVLSVACDFVGIWHRLGGCADRAFPLLSYEWWRWFTNQHVCSRGTSLLPHYLPCDNWIACIDDRKLRYFGHTLLLYPSPHCHHP